MKCDKCAADWFDQDIQEIKAHLDSAMQKKMKLEQLNTEAGSDFIESSEWYDVISDLIEAKGKLVYLIQRIEFALF